MFIPLNTSNWSQVKIKINETIQKHIEMITDDELKKEFEKQFTYDATYVSKEQIDFLQEEIKKIENHESYTKILIQHHHLVAVDDSIEVKEMGDILNSEEIKNFIKDNNIKVLLVQPQFPKTSTEAISKEVSDVKIVEFNPLEENIFEKWKCCEERETTKNVWKNQVISKEILVISDQTL